MEKNPLESAIKRVEFLVLTKNSEFLSMAKDLAEHFSFYGEFLESFQNVESELYLGSSPLLTLISFEERDSLQERRNVLGRLRAVFPKTQIVMALQGEKAGEDYSLLKEAGAHYVILPNECKTQSKLYFLAAVLVQGTYFPVPITDFFPGTQLNFNAYHKLLLNRKFIPVFFSGFPISDKKFRRLEASKQVYIRRESLEDYRKYVETYHDRRGTALKKRCRALMMTLVGTYGDLMLQLTLDTEAGQGEVVKEKLAHWVRSSLELGEYLQECPDVWNVIAQSLDFKFCYHERAVHILAYALCISVKAKLAAMNELVLTALLADLGILDLPVDCYKNLQRMGEKKLSPQDLESFQKHPMVSLERAKQRQVELPEGVQTAIVCTHERHDQKGFPRQVSEDKIPEIAKVIFFCEILDQRIRLVLEDGMVTHDYVRRQVWEEERHSLAHFSADFLDKIEKVLIA